MKVGGNKCKNRGGIKIKKKMSAHTLEFLKRKIKNKNEIYNKIN
jgi:hypothetical protein